MIKFYSSNCPRCKVLKQQMDIKKIEYELISDSEIYLKVAEENKIMSMPFAEIDSKVVGTKELMKFINDYKGE